MSMSTSTSTSFVTPSSTPDLDTIKMFVGQVPKTWTEPELRAVLEEFGPIFFITILKDKGTKESRGCCFVTYYHRKSALAAQNACHNVKILPGMSHPMQMKPADNENRHERKIFVGMLTKSLDETDLRGMFVDFGLIEEVSILRDTNGVSRGCGFVTYATKTSALAAIRKMHQSMQMTGCSSPLVVKIADLQQRTDCLKKKVTVTAYTKNFESTGGGVKQSQESRSPNYLGILQNLFHQSEPLDFKPFPLDLPGLTLQDDLFLNFLTAGSTNNFWSDQGQFDALLKVKVNPVAFSGLRSTPGHSEGPEGSNLFIYHLPQDYCDVDLLNLFGPFGLIVSAKVFIDRTTNLSKCFGFVSYDNAVSAQLAINALNGFNLGSKRLKVQHKKPKEKPY